MKIPSFLLNREFKELHKFESLENSERSIVFYSEDNFSIIYFEPILTELTKNLERQVCYLTSSSNDPMLTTKNKRIKAFSSFSELFLAIVGRSGQNRPVRGRFASLCFRYCSHTVTSTRGEAS